VTEGGTQEAESANLLNLQRGYNIILVIFRLDSNIKTTWHVNPVPDDTEEKMTSRQGHNLMVVAATRVWEEVYVCKKPAIEEVHNLFYLSNFISQLHVRFISETHAINFQSFLCVSHHTVKPKSGILPS